MKPASAAGLAFITAFAAAGCVPPAQAQQDVVARVAHEASGAIARCFKRPDGYGPPYPAVSLRLNFRPDGNLDGPPQLADPPGGDAKHSATTAAVLSAASRCMKIEDATRYRENYPAWQSITLVFQPEGM